MLVETSFAERRRSHFNQDELVEQYSTTHVGDSDTSHDEQRTDHETLRPCLEKEAIRRSARRFGDIICRRSHVGSRYCR
jgi:hypothetical protein